jgi:hypothetical protein
MWVFHNVGRFPHEGGLKEAYNAVPRPLGGSRGALRSAELATPPPVSYEVMQCGTTKL